jgi:uncharacterized protein YlxW (UPF0749 family)
MIKPIPTINHKSGKRSTVYYDDYKRLEKYCDQLQLEKTELANQLGQYAKVVNEYQEVNNINQEIT